jgi:hypothetical protein
MFRSMQMGYYSIVMPHDSAWEILNELGELSAISFLDQNGGESFYHREFSVVIKKCEDIEHKLNEIESHLIEYELPIRKCTDSLQFLKNV